MKFVVAVKQVPGTPDAPVDENGIIRRDRTRSILDPYSESALASILAFRKDGDTVEVVTMGPPQAESALRRCIAFGADKAYLITDRDMAGADTWATARTLAAFILKFADDADIIAFGRQSTDGDTGQVPSEVAGLLGVQQFCYTSELRRNEEGIVAYQDYGDFTRSSVVPKGSVISFREPLICGDIASMEGFIKGRNSVIEVKDRIALGLGAYSVGLKGSLTKIIHTEPVNASRRNTMIEITNPDTASDLIIKEWKGCL